MTSHDSGGGLGSRMPSEEAYWENLARRVTEECAPLLDELARTRGPWWGDMAAHSRPLALIAAAAIVVALTLVPPKAAASGGSDPGPLARSLEPSDPLVRDLLGGQTPPRIETILFQEGEAQP